MVQLVHSVIVFCTSSMVAEISTIHTRHGGGSVRSNVVCHFWMLGKCNRNPCRFMHRELPHPNVYRRTSKQSNVLADIQSLKSSNQVIKYRPSKRPNVRNSLASATEDGGAEYKYTRESFSSGTNIEADNVKKIRESSKCSNTSDLTAEGDASEDKNVNKSSRKACEDWMSNDCVKGDGCQFLHSWFVGDWFSLLTKLDGHTEVIILLVFFSI